MRRAYRKEMEHGREEQEPGTSIDSSNGPVGRGLSYLCGRHRQGGVKNGSHSFGVTARWSWALNQVCGPFPTSLALRRKKEGGLQGGKERKGGEENRRKKRKELDLRTSSSWPPSQ